MDFEYILANLMAEVDDAVGVLFLDDSGETVDLASTEESLYQMRVLGAYLGIYMRQIERIAEACSLGDLHLIQIEKGGLHIYAVTLPDDYYLVLVQRRPALVALARRRLERAAVELASALFT